MGRVFDNPVLLIVVLLIVVLLFGAKKLPELAGSVAKSMNIFKAEAKAGKREDAAADTADPKAAQSRPLEGRVVDDAPRTQGPDRDSYDSQQRHSA